LNLSKLASPCTLNIVLCFSLAYALCYNDKFLDYIITYYLLKLLQNVPIKGTNNYYICSAHHCINVCMIILGCIPSWCLMYQIIYLFSIVFVVLNLAILIKYNTGLLARKGDGWTKRLPIQPHIWFQKVSFSIVVPV
jgi:hypothetical protein